MANQVEQPAQRDLVISRILNAPRELVFKAWTDPKHIAKWWGPKGFTAPVCKLDVRVGGAILIHMRGPDGVVYPMHGVFREIIVPERLVFISKALEDEKGNAGFEVVTTVTFDEHNGKTKLSLHAAVTVLKPTSEVAKSLGGMEVGWNQSLDRLTALVEEATIS